MEDEIDLRKYVRVLLQHWKLILGLAAAASIAAFAVASILPRSYEAKALVVVTSPRYILNFEPRIETATGQDAVRVNPKAYLGLATSDDLLTQLLSDPALASLEADQRTVTALQGKLQATAGADPTLLELQVTDADPVRAAAIANAWGILFVQYANEIYGYSQSEQAFFETQAVSAKADYDQAQSALEDFLKNNRIDELQREIGVRQALIDRYRSEQIASHGESLSQQMQNRREILAGYYADLAAIEQILADAQALRDQVQADGPSAAADTGNALTFVLLRNRAFGGSGNVQLQLSLAQPVEPVTVAEVDSLIAVLESRQAETQAKIDVVSAKLLTDLSVSEGALPEDPVNRLVGRYSTEVLDLQAQLEAQQAQQREITQARDLAWETYATVARKAQETRIASQRGEDVMRLASRAGVPLKPATSRLTVTGLAGMLGLMFGMLAVFAREWWREADTEAVSAGAPLDDRSLSAVASHPGDGEASRAVEAILHPPVK